jgi:hypothetical protein
MENAKEKIQGSQSRGTRPCTGQRLEACRSFREWPVLHVAMYVLVVHFPADKPFGIKDCVFRIGVESIFCTITDTDLK